MRDRERVKYPVNGMAMLLSIQEDRIQKKGASEEAKGKIQNQIAQTDQIKEDIENREKQWPEIQEEEKNGRKEMIGDFSVTVDPDKLETTQRTRRRF